MDTKHRVGVLLPEIVLRRVVRHAETWETVVQYAAAANELSLEVVLFSLSGYNAARQTVRGYVRRSCRWKAWKGPLPAVIHNRDLPKTARAARRMRALSREFGRRFFNPPACRDKWVVWRRLAESDEIRAHLPPSWPLGSKLCRKLPELTERHGGIVIKPRRGSLGIGIVFVEPVSGRRPGYRMTPPVGPSYVLDRKSFVRRTQRMIAHRRHIVQETVPLFKYRRRRCDLRVPVQRDGDGRWCVVPATVRQATKHQYLTNIARGGNAFAYDRVLDEAFGARRARAVWADVERLSLAVAERLAEYDPALADLGLDIGIDTDGKPWVIEVNFRDLRKSPKSARQAEAYAQLYRNPIAYAHYLISEVGRAEA